VGEGWDALLFDPSRPEEVAASLDRVLTDRRLARRLADSGRAKAREQFSWDRITRDLQLLYERVIGEHTGGRAGAVPSVLAEVA